MGSHEPELIGQSTPPPHIGDDSLAFQRRQFVERANLIRDWVIRKKGSTFPEADASKLDPLAKQVFRQFWDTLHSQKRFGLTESIGNFSYLANPAVRHFINNVTEFYGDQKRKLDPSLNVSLHAIATGHEAANDPYLFSLGFSPDFLFVVMCGHDVFEDQRKAIFKARQAKGEALTLNTPYVERHFSSVIKRALKLWPTTGHESSYVVRHAIIALSDKPTLHGEELEGQDRLYMQYVRSQGFGRKKDFRDPTYQRFFLRSKAEILAYASPEDRYRAKAEFGPTDWQNLAKLYPPDTVERISRFRKLVTTARALDKIDTARLDAVSLLINLSNQRRSPTPYPPLNAEKVADRTRNIIEKVPILFGMKNLPPHYRDEFIRLLSIIQHAREGRMPEDNPIPYGAETFLNTNSPPAYTQGPKNPRLFKAPLAEPALV